MSGKGTTYHFDVKMTCSGCSSAIERVLTKLEAIKAVGPFNVDLEKQVVDVEAGDYNTSMQATGDPPLDLESLREKIAKTGKEIRSYEARTA